MKKHTTILAAAIALFAAASCSSPLPIEGTWETSETHEKEDDEDVSVDMTRQLTFTPTDKKSGTVISDLKGTLHINEDEFKDIDFSNSIPGTYSIEKDMIVISYDLSAIEANTKLNHTFSPEDWKEFEETVDFKDFQDFLKEMEEDLKNDLAPDARETYKNVVIDGNRLTMVRDDETFVFSKKN